MMHHIYCADLAYGEPLNIFCFGDLQVGSEGFDKEAWQEFKHEFKTTKNAVGLGLGDMTDWIRPTMRARIYGALAHDDSAKKQLDDKIRLEQDVLIDEMQFMSGKLIGLHMGHHDWDFSTGMNSTQRLAEALRSQYLGWQASTRVVLRQKGTRINFSYTMISTHGNANARRVGGSTQWMENNLMQGWIADQYIMGHGCKSANWAPAERYIIRRQGPPGFIVNIPRCLIVGGFCRGYTNGWESSYVERNGFVPQPIMWGLIRLRVAGCKAIAESRSLKPNSLSNRRVLIVENYNKGPNANASFYEGDDGKK